MLFKALVILGLAMLAPNAASAATLRGMATTDTGPGGDVAFVGDLAVLAHGTDNDDPSDDGFRLVDISKPSDPRTVGSYTCPGGAFDVGVYEDLVILSSNAKTWPDCDRPAGARDFAGIHVISIADPARPVQVASVATNCTKGSHTSTLLPDPGRGRLVVYANGQCEDIVEIPLDDPAAARPVAQIVSRTGGCHDLNIHVVRELAVCANQQAGAELWDLRNPVRPRLISVLHVPWSQHHHNSIFSNDGRTLAIGEEAISSIGAPRCGTDDPVGAIAFYDVSDPALPVFKGRFQLPRPATSGGLCTSHQFNVIPLRSERDVLVSAWYQGGTSVIDFTNPSKPHEIAAWQAPTEQNAWSSYWYRGHVFSVNVDILAGPFESRSSRGMDILRLDGPGFAGAERLPYLNAQTQMPLSGERRPASLRGRPRGRVLFGPPRRRAFDASAVRGPVCLL